MLPSDMTLQIGNVRNYNNKILISSPSFKTGTNVKINLNEEKDKPDVRPKGEGIMKTEPDVKPKVKTKPNIKLNKEHKPITDSSREHKSNIKFDKEHKQDVKMIRTQPDTNNITYEEEKVAFLLGITSIFTVWCMFK